MFNDKKKINTGNFINFNSGISSSGDFYPLLPLISQGTDDYNRIGNKIRPTSLVVKVRVTLDGGINGSEIYEPRLLILSSRSSKDYLQKTNAIDPSKLLDTGDTHVPYEGWAEDNMCRINHRDYVVHVDKVFSLVKPEGVTEGGAAGAGDQIVVGKQSWKDFTFRIATPKTLVYQDETQSWPTNFAPYITLGYCQPDGNASPDRLTTGVHMQFLSYLSFKDE